MKTAIRRTPTRLLFSTAFLVLTAIVPAWAWDCGDVDRNGSIASSDALRVLRLAVGIPVSVRCPCAASPATVGTGSAEIGFSCGDVNWDAAITASDARILLRISVGLPGQAHCPPCVGTTTSTT